MNCFDCQLDGAATPAVAVCYDCGAGVARDHHLTRTATINRIIVVEPSARLIRCVVCAAAHDAAHNDAEPKHHDRTRHHAGATR